MATLSAEQIEQKKQLLAEKAKQMKAIYDELVEAGAIALGSPLATKGTQELSEDELDQIGGGYGGIFGIIAGWFGITKGRSL